MTNKKLDAALKAAAGALAETSRECHGRGWALGSSGNFSACLSRDPLRLAITPSGVNKGRVAAGQIVVVDGGGRVVVGTGKPSDETLLHLAAVRALGAGAVLHTHSVWNTLVSLRFANRGSVSLRGFEMLKVLDRRYTHESEARIPILENDQDYERLSAVLQKRLEENPGTHAVLLRGHGLYTWGTDLAHARLCLEAIELLLEVIGRSDAGN